MSKKWHLPLILGLTACLFTGCGDRGIPVIKQELLDKKLSVLMLTSSALTASSKEAIAQSLKDWQDSNAIAFDWVKDLNALNEDVTTKLKTKSYDYIYVAGNELFPSANETLQSSQSSAKWTFLQSQPFAVGTGNAVSDQATLLQVDTQQLETMKNKSVQDLVFQPLAIEWVTRSDRPIPSTWAPSEEADHIVLLDNNPQWYQQLSFQILQHHASWVIFYSPADADQMQKVKNMGVSVMDFAGAVTAELNWPQIMNNRLAVMKSKSWKSGVQNYNVQELKELKMK
ncbi:hypothetical protein [Paenibacillus roseipurpureus]|uniref:Lipoprotein n=1 Tax=Paenibacillus roseopurpureus TaxID=2918901 RepID=A0AA96LRI1_9BACL|nr:hypothetical protein [Paenibacillus sp. MBLB1832]WNR46710.1 hypothetical protein MJB10_11650 [Paenibacillus sp. MBLB1832]